MRSIVCNLWGPLAINSYGSFIAFGLILFIWRIQKDRRFNTLHLEPHFSYIISIAILATLVGARLLYILSEQTEKTNFFDFFSFWQGGLSILGGVIGIIVVVPWYLYHYRIPILPFFDLVSTHIGLLQSIARIGCFTAGCCFGIPSNALFAVQYTDPHSHAPLFVYLHPTQLYSAGALFGIYLFMVTYARHLFKKPGQCTMLYIMLISLERFIIDFWRAERTMIFEHISYNQLVATILFTSGAIGFILITLRLKKHS